GQSWSTLQGAQYCLGRHALRMAPKLRLAIVTFGATSTTAHHQPPGQSLSTVHLPKIVQNAFASVGEVP
ncbi:MAG: hypothetical protein M3O46_10275, partial [Myxococcota bacterium]|nr:hypothetical protein [Myxococcota bacterium]